MIKNNKIGIIYFFVHFLLEVTSFYTLSTYTSNNYFWIMAIMYDLFAFVPQALFGAVSDKFRNLNLGIIGSISTSLALILLYFNISPIIVLIFLIFGNCVIHVHGAEATLRTSNGKMFPTSLFVSGGAFGIIVGRILHNQLKFNPLIVLLFNLIGLLLIIFSIRYKKYEKEILDCFDYSNAKTSTIVVISLSVFVVAVRSYMSYGIPTGWNKTLLQTILLFVFMGTGKALGGVLIDKFNIKITSIISTLLSIPFLIFGDHNMYISLIGIMLFSMTMPITLALIVSKLKKNPGIAFGWTTIGLFVGSFPSFFIKIKSIFINGILFTFLGILCTIILYKLEK